MVRGRGVRRKWCGALLLAAALAGGATACGPETPPAPGGPASGTTAPPAPSAPDTSDTSDAATRTPDASTSTAPSTSPTSTSTAPPDEPRPGEVLVEVVVNGGFAGVSNKLVVHYDGSWTSRSGTRPPRTGQQTPAEAAELRAALEDPAYARVPNRPTGSPIADGFQYFITYRHRLVVSGDGERPPALQRVFAALPEGGPPTSP
ncbi:hypothetical protein AQF52_5413 [Streptomyces venezuelae]|uniref:hypothetical protein n=1 Tax=Streptomyces gardneri TaxID=66892 RepID=UPI000722FBDD|nr:hypothetical protein [Streptomyces gardneri]ALO11007.1 hypothetical protein AQF52_5413 [Streptomyces venezuelae]QPK47953.1 hypothetical protein H4W23_27165 [Streptomyces gardneri]WRK39409.1 hypothetical protein U0M97_27290 [Streptomyces venezuelae]